MTIAQQVRAISTDLAQREARADFFKLCRLMLKHGSAFNARANAEAERARPRVQNILQKAAVSGGGLDSWSSISEYQTIQESFQASLRTLSVFDAVLNGGMVRAPLRSRGFSITTGIAGAVIGERGFKPISSLALAQQLLELRKSTAIIVVTKEVADFPGASQLFADELTKAVVAATDSIFLSSLIAATTPTPSAGATLANVTTDFDTLLSAITTTATSRIFYIASPSNIKSIMTKANAGGQPAYPNLGINGGEIFPGVTAIASDSISSSAALMFDASAIVGNSDAIIPGRSEQSTIQFESAPDSPPTASTTVLTLWQNDLLALRMERFFGFTVMRTNGLSSLSGVSY